MAEVIIRVKRDGSTEVKAEGVQGTGCATQTGPFIQALGKVVSSRPTSEMFEENQLAQHEEVKRQ